MNNNDDTRRRHKQLLVAQGLLSRLKIQITLESMRAGLTTKTSPPSTTAKVLGLFGGSAISLDLVALILSAIGGPRVARWLPRIRQTLRFSQLVIDVLQLLKTSNTSTNGSPIVRKRTDGLIDPQ